ncbi:hypothetical protein L249_3370 [Ophiocordyceps polyrhachis-furcata BCC 54312]|uniref:Haloacid dehalogenase-like hydrolase n=1 Tax=Ophiocordyceps polyrhachis-furcata BCC 54312 TaxID=1330021 RepID=A0A367LMM6_9HYPO|nr:hypothetical protein L249_3370 [Ophiocordyceps polyrhachis-furcata BCC 54312]
MYLIFDFDGTITVQDTIGELAASAVAWQQRLGCSLQGAWDEAVRAYGSDLAAAEKTKREERRTVEDEIEFLAEARTVEEASLNRVERTGIFAGLGRTDMFRMGAEAVREGRITIRAGFGALTERAAGSGWRTCIISAHWSGAFIEGALSGTGFCGEVRANEVDGASGRIGGGITTSADKVAALRRLVAVYDDDDADATVFYIGDAMTDFECLIKEAGGADYGVVMAGDGDESSVLVRALRRLGFEVPAVGEMRRRGVRIGWAGSFDEVCLDDVASR